jgi:hypothetical protein
MTDDDIIQIAREAGFDVDSDIYGGFIKVDDIYINDKLARFAALALAFNQRKREPVAYWHRDKGFYWAKPTEIHMDTITVVPPLALYSE